MVDMLKWIVVLVVSFGMASGALVGASGASADGASDGGEYQALLLEDQQYWLTGKFVCPPQPVDRHELVDISFGAAGPRSEYVVELIDYVTAAPDGWLCAYRSGSLAYGLHMGDAVHVNLVPIDRLQVWVSVAAGGQATMGMGLVQF